MQIQKVFVEKLGLFESDGPYALGNLICKSWKSFHSFPYSKNSKIVTSANWIQPSFSRAVSNHSLKFSGTARRRTPLEFAWTLESAPESLGCGMTFICSRTESTVWFRTVIVNLPSWHRKQAPSANSEWTVLNKCWRAKSNLKIICQSQSVHWTKLFNEVHGKNGFRSRFLRSSPCYWRRLKVYTKNFLV